MCQQPSDSDRRASRTRPVASRQRAARLLLAAALGVLSGAVLACGGGGGSSDGGGEPNPALIFGGPGSLDGSFEGDERENCNGEDGATSFFASEPQDCDYFVPDAPDGQQVFRDGPGGGGEAFSWVNVFEPAPDVWTRIHVKLENDFRSFNNLICLLDEQGHNAFHCLNFHAAGSDPIRMEAGGATCSFPDTRVVGEWCDYLYHASTLTGEGELWCDCNGMAAGCGDDLDAELPDAVCTGGPNPAQAFAGFVLYGSAAESGWQIDVISIYDEDPFPVAGAADSTASSRASPSGRLDVQEYAFGDLRSEAREPAALSAASRPHRPTQVETNEGREEHR